MSIVTIHKLTKEIEDKTIVRDYMLKLLEKVPDNLEEEIMLKYIETQNTVAVSDYLNDVRKLKFQTVNNGKVSSRRYYPKDVSALLKMKKNELNGDEQIIDFSLMLHKASLGKVTIRKLLELARGETK